ncbi:hypothetical protein [Nocardia gipuzkoensis]|uniref:hypothetical protein n=1 Tax=Nocardia gipuzkoensis TaxID=2749991 RepID=UPI003EE17FD3
MTTEYATVLAQVIPVLALAIGLEVRSLAQARAEAAKTRQPGTDWRSGVIAGMAFVQVYLGFAEFAALETIAEGSMSVSHGILIALAIAVTFGSPVISAIFW